MTLRKISVLALAFMFVMIFAGNSFAILGEGYFGPDNPPPNGIIIEPPFYDSPYVVRRDDYRRQDDYRRDDDYRRQEEARRQEEERRRREEELRREEDYRRQEEERRRREDELRRQNDYRRQEDYRREEDRRRFTPNYEKYSADPERVIRSYGFDRTTTENLLDLHYSAARGNGKGERYDRYTMIYRDFPTDYLAAYEASRNAYDMADYDMAMYWVNKALEILPQYVPARQFKRTVEGGLKRR